MSSTSIIRLKRKASTEPIEGLVVALKKSKSDVINTNEVYFKFAATVKDEESVKDHLQAVLRKEKEQKLSKWRDPRCSAVSQKNVVNICDKFKKELKTASQKNRLDLLNNRRLIFAETLPIDDPGDESPIQDPEIRPLFQLYDIIEENEEPKKQSETASKITCNGTLLLPEKSNDYVYDVYIADGQIDESFVNSNISLCPLKMTNEDIYSGDSSDNSEIYEDEDDSNDENNWRNEYPEDENSHPETSDSEYDEYDGERYCDNLRRSFDKVNLDEEIYSSDDESIDYSKERVLLQETLDDADW